MPAEITIIRTDFTQKQQILGQLFYKNFACYTLELPDLGNKRDFSCIPGGEYRWVKRQPYGNFPYVHIDLIGVPGRSGVKIHAGNYYTQILGCILVGNTLKDINKDGIKDVCNSKLTLAKLMRLLPYEGIITVR